RALVRSNLNRLLQLSSIPTLALPSCNGCSNARAGASPVRANCLAGPCVSKRLIRGNGSEFMIVELSECSPARGSVKTAGLTRAWGPSLITILALGFRLADRQIESQGLMVRQGFAYRLQTVAVAAWLALLSTECGAVTNPVL